MRYSLFLLCVFLFSGCSFKTIIHPYPYQYDGNPEDATEWFEIQKISDYVFIDPDSSVSLALGYKNGSLHIRKTLSSEPSWEKTDEFINPITQQKYIIQALARYDSEVNADEFILTVSESDSNFIIAYTEGLIEDATVFFDENIYRFTALEFWESKVRKVKGEDGTEWHHYPYGGIWSLSVNDVILGEIVQGSPIKKRMGIKANYGFSYTFILLEEIDQIQKAEFINVLLAYLALVDMEYYYYECDPNNPQDEACPGSIVVH